jgi:hypothetical protein
MRARDVHARVETLLGEPVRLPVVLGDRSDRIFDPEQNCRRTLIEYCQPARSKWPMSSAPSGRGGTFN